MKIKLSILFSLMAFFVVTLAIVDAHSFSVVQYETTIESVGEFENSESESIADTVDLVNNSNILEMYYTNLSFSDESFVLFTLTKDIFRPPCFV